MIGVSEQRRRSSEAAAAEQQSREERRGKSEKGEECDREVCAIVEKRSSLAILSTLHVSAFNLFAHEGVDSQWENTPNDGAAGSSLTPIGHQHTVIGGACSFGGAHSLLVVACVVI